MEATAEVRIWKFSIEVTTNEIEIKTVMPYRLSYLISEKAIREVECLSIWLQSLN